MICFRVDGNKQIATGHVMRCLAIAKALKKKGENCTFIIADHFTEKLIEENGFNTICLESKWDNLDYELDALTIFLKSQNIKTLIIDSYFVTESYLTKLKKVVKLVYIDDMNMFRYPVDMLINYSFNFNKYNYEARYEKENTKLLLGSKYVPLRKEFTSKNINKSGLDKQVKNILITTGGSDPYNFSGTLINEILSKDLYKTYIFHVIIGSYYENILELENLSKKHSNIILHKNVKNMSDLMINSDIAISASGTTLYELCACGTPSICYVFADNQLEGAEAFGDRDIIPYAGDIRDNMKLVINKIFYKVNELIQSEPLWLSYSIKMREFIDGKGSARIAEEIIKL